MGACCSRCCRSSDGDDGNGEVSAAELELQAQADLKSLCIVRGMSAPTIEIEDRTKISGQGLALAAVVLEQDAAYWEVHVEQQSSESSQDFSKEPGKLKAMFGVATKKDRQFYASLDEKSNEGTSESNGTDYMCTIPVSHGDIIGVILQQSDLPMLQFYLNGELLNGSCINRFRGIVYPSLFLPYDNDDYTFSLRIVFKESDFRKGPPSSRFIPVVVARGLV